MASGLFAVRGEAFDSFDRRVIRVEPDADFYLVQSCAWPCVACGSADTLLYSMADEDPNDFPVIECGPCGAVESF